ncbi:carbohydrate-binding module family 50 protein [Phanerochaete sordida]|uniref:Carbohydrate-binding module family 50 protein n=1 Tax=Phanerochaete sordida TaxID=48140 RepID=A0A9P3LBW7_9APHY|nr:carbohydrate-binding module family 50 protein [Phanerochaete sordida]
MGRWTQYDEDEYRLPEGMQRAGYDADTGKYYFKDRAGKVWEGPEGAQYGELKPVGSKPVVLHETPEDDEDLEAAGRRPDGYQPLALDAGAASRPVRGMNSQAYRTLFPFFMIVIVALLLVWRLVGPHFHDDSGTPQVSFCTGNTTAYRVQAGDTCWDISQGHSFSLKRLRDANQGLDCDRLTPGEIICLPPSDPQRK